jgi:diguanylate cyclase
VTGSDGRAPLVASPRRAVGVLLAGVVPFVYLWPIADGAFGTVATDSALRLVAAVVVGLAAARAGWRATGDARAAWLAVVVAAQVAALVRAAELVGAWAGTAPPVAVLTGAHVVVVGLLAAAVHRLLVHPAGAPWRRVVELAALACVATLLVWLAAQLDETSRPAADVLLRAGADVVLLGVALLALLLSSSRQAAVRWPMLAAGAAVVAVADGLEAVLEAPVRLTGGLWCAGLLLLAAAALTGPVSSGDAVSSARARRWLFPLLLLLSAPLLGAFVAVVRPTGLVGARWALGVLGLLLLLVLLRQQMLLVEERRQVVDLTAERSTFEHRAFHDPLTDLANRALFLNRLDHALALHRRHHRPLTVLFGDLDGFKAINDEHGHRAGDELLRAIAERLRSCLRPADTLARLSGDEFAVLLEEDADALPVLRRMESVLRDPFALSTGEIRAGMSVGFAHVGADDATPTSAELLERADAQMYQAKRGRDGRAAVDAAFAPQTLHEALPGAIERGEVTVVYQPIVDTGSGCVVSLEALARWRHAGQEIPPTTFVAVAQELGLLSELTAGVVDQACAQLRRWCDAVGHDRLTVSVNLEPEQLADTLLHIQLQDARERHRLRHGQLVLECPAAAVVADGEHGVRVSRDLAGRGTPLSLSGFSEDTGLGQLHRLRLASVKVPDGARATLEQSGERDRLLRALRGLGRELGVSVVVEGLERTEDLESVRRLGGLVAQGYAVARPGPAADLQELVLHGRPSDG